MKTIKFIAVAAAALALAVSCKTNEAAGLDIEAQLPTKAETDSVSYLLGIYFGSMIASNNFAEEPSELNYAEIKKGMNAFLTAEGDPRSPEFNEQFKISPEMINTMFNDYIAKRNAYTAEVNKKKGEKFLEENKAKDGVVVTESGLQYKIIEDGNDVKPAETDTVWVHYTGTLIDGTEFDASDKTQEPVRMMLNRVVKGWTEGLQLIGEGGKIELYIPAELGYGSRNMGTIGPNSTLIFEIELTKVGKVATEEKAE